jgi:hypothetical protein
MPDDLPSDAGPPLTISALRVARSSARRELEVAQMRARQHAPDAPDTVAALRARVDVLTEELITRYREDLGLVDSLLDPAYPAKVTSTVAESRTP